MTIFQNLRTLINLYPAHYCIGLIAIGIIYALITIWWNLIYIPNRPINKTKPKLSHKSETLASQLLYL